MAKKTVSSKRTETKHVKVIRMIKSEKTGDYRIKENIIDKDEVKNFLGSK